MIVKQLYYTVHYDTTLKYIILTWKGFQANLGNVKGTQDVQNVYLC